MYCNNKLFIRTKLKHKKTFLIRNIGKYSQGLATVNTTLCDLADRARYVEQIHRFFFDSGVFEGD